MAIDAPLLPSFSPWPDRLRHSAIILLAAGAGAGRAGRRSANCRRCAPSRSLLCIAAAALVPWRLHDAGRLARRRPRRQSGRDRGGQRRRRRHAGSRRAARPRRPRHPSQCRGGAARAGAAQERARAVRAALARDHHRAARGDRDHRTAPRDLSRSCAGRSLDGIDHHAGAGADRCSAAPTNAC